MRKFTIDSKLSFRSVPEIQDALARLVLSHKRGLSLPGREMSREVLVNLLVVHFDSLDPESQSALIEAALPLLWVILHEPGDPPPAMPTRASSARRGA